MSDDAHGLTDPVAESVRRALQLVGPAESGAESVWDEETIDRPVA
jgi:hypothetical protein